MDKNEKKKPNPTESDSTKVDANALAGSKNSVGAQSIRDGRPSTCDDVVEAMDEGGPGIPTP